jgi:outer membrane lipoprotein carrier protein
MRFQIRHQSVPVVFVAFAALFATIPDVEAKELSGNQVIKRVQKTYDKLETMSARFRHEFIWAMVGESEVSEGRMLLSGDDLFRYETDNQVTVSDGTTLWRFNVGSQQIIAENVASADAGSLPRDFLFEFPKQFDVESSQLIENDIYQLKLVPKEAGLGVSNVNVSVDGKKWITTRLSFDDDAGNTTVYELLDVELNVEIDESRFQFSPPESATLFDLR